jgi:hypothetical protein
VGNNHPQGASVGEGALVVQSSRRLHVKSVRKEGCWWRANPSSAHSRWRDAVVAAQADNHAHEFLFTLILFFSIHTCSRHGFLKILRRKKNERKFNQTDIRSHLDFIMRSSSIRVAIYSCIYLVDVFRNMIIDVVHRYVQALTMRRFKSTWIDIFQINMQKSLAGNKSISSSFLKSTYSEEPIQSNLDLRTFNLRTFLFLNLLLYIRTQIRYTYFT